MCFLKSGATKGVNHGTLEQSCYDQVKKAEKIIISLIGKNPEILQPGHYSKLFCSFLQRGWKWNENRMDFSTDEDRIEMEMKINPKLIKYGPHELIRNIPQQFKRFKLNNANDCKILSAICNEPVRAMAIHNKLDTTNKWGHKAARTDAKSTPFQIYNLPECRRNLTKHSGNLTREEDKMKLRKEKLEHLLKCKPCFKSLRIV